MGGTSSSTTSQSATTSPWTNAQPDINGILSGVSQNLGNTALTNNEGSALGHLAINGQNYTSNYAPQIGNYANQLLAGGGANNQAGAVNQNYQNYQAQTNPLASNTDYNPMNTPGIGTALSGLSNNILSSVNGQFAAAGRDGSPANSQSAAYGLAQGLAPILTQQYNQNVQNQQGAASNLYGAGNTNAGILSGLQQQYLANQGQGVTASGQALDASNAGANATLQAEAQRRGIPVQALGLLSQIGIPIAGLGSQSTGQGSTQNQMSGAQQFATIAGGIGSLFGATGTPGGKAVAGLFG